MNECSSPAQSNKKSRSSCRALYDQKVKPDPYRKMIGRKQRQIEDLPELRTASKLEFSKVSTPHTPQRDRVRWLDILKNDSSFSAARQSLAGENEGIEAALNRDSNLRVSC